MSPRLVQTYREIRRSGSMRVGYAAADALSAARTRLKWESLADCSLVELVAEADPFADPGDWEYDHDRQMAEDQGVFTLVGRYRLDVESPWVVADSVGGMIGESYTLSKDNPYLPDIQAATVRAFADAHRARIARVRDLRAGRRPHCHQVIPV